MKRALLAGMVGMIVAWSAVAVAQPAMAERQRLVIVHKNPVTATKISVAGTLTGIMLLFAGAKMGNYEGDAMKAVAATTMVIGPSWGEWWVQDRIVVTPGMAARVLGLAAGGAAIGVDQKCNAIARMTDGTSGCAGTTKNDTLLGIGIALATAGTIYDIVDAGRQARERRFIVVPAVTPTSAGLGFAATF